MTKKIFLWEPIVWHSTIFETYSIQSFDNSAFFYSLICGYLIFFIGLTGLFLRESSIIYILIAIELLLFGLNFVFLSLSVLLHEPQLQVMVLLILTITAAETAIGLSLIILYHKILNTTSIDILTQLKY